jgi:hypothetical protein
MSTAPIVIRNSDNTDVVPSLDRAELFFDFKNLILYLGNKDSTQSPLTLFADQSYLLVETIDPVLTTQAPTSATVYNELVTKYASIVHGNQFQGINKFPYVNLNDDLTGLTDCPVTVRMFQEQIEIALTNNFAQVVYDNLTIIPQYKILSLEFSENEVWEVTHNLNLDFSKLEYSLYNSNNIKMHAPINIIDKNSFEVLFSKPESGYIKISYNSRQT